MLKKVLIVEDSQLLRAILHDTIKSAGFLVYEAANGRNGLSSVTEMTPDIILLDVIMPVMDGMAMYEELQKHEATKHIPVIMLSTSEDGSVIAWMNSHGLTHIKKDNDMSDNVIAHIREILGTPDQS